MTNDSSLSDVELAERRKQEIYTIPDCHVGDKIIFTEKVKLHFCPKCKIDKPLKDYSKHGRSKTGRYTICKPCHALTVAEGQARKALKEKHGVPLEMEDVDDDAYREALAKVQADAPSASRSQRLSAYLMSKHMDMAMIARILAGASVAELIVYNREMDHVESVPDWNTRLFVAKFLTKVHGYDFIPKQAAAADFPQFLMQIWQEFQGKSLVAKTEQYDSLREEVGEQRFKELTDDRPEGMVDNGD